MDVVTIHTRQEELEPHKNCDNLENYNALGYTSYRESSAADAPDSRRDKGQPVGAHGVGTTGALPAPAQAGGQDRPAGPSASSLVRRRTNATQSIDLKSSNCPQPVGFLHISDAVTREHKCTLPAPCKRWDCPVCGERKKNILIDGTRDGALRIQQDKTLPDHERVLRHLVLTFQTDDDTPPGLALHRFFSSLWKAGYKNLRYQWVKEFTRKGKRHFHLLLNRHIPHSLLKHLWSNATDRKSFYVYITRADHSIRNAGAYIGKYVSKGIHSRKFRKGEHRYGHDRKTDWSPAVTSLFKKPDGLLFEFEYNPSSMKVSKLLLEHFATREAFTVPNQSNRPPPQEVM